VTEKSAFGQAHKRGKEMEKRDKQKSERHGFREKGKKMTRDTLRESNPLCHPYRLGLGGGESGVKPRKRHRVVRKDSSTRVTNKQQKRGGT